MAGETVADNFAMFLEALSSTQFGTAQNPKYVAHGILGIANKNGISSNPYLPSDPITLSGCVSSVDPGTGYQAVCKNTGGRRYSICENSFDTIFSDIASELINALSGI